MGEVLTVFCSSAEGDVCNLKQTSGSQGNLGLYPRSEQ